MPTYDQSAEAERLRLILHDWVTRNPGWAQTLDTTSWVTQVRLAVDVARDLLETTELAEVQFAGFMGTPDGQLIQFAVQRVMPPPYGIEFRLLVEAVTLAAKEKQSGQRAKAGIATAGGLLVLFTMIAGRS